MKIYVDSEFKCHTSNPYGTFREVQSDFFDGKCDAFVEGYCCEIRENAAAIYPWKPYDQLAAAQAQYEADLAEAANAYQEGVDSV